MHIRTYICCLLPALLFLLFLPAHAGDSPSSLSHGISLFGDLKYPPDFTHFDYVNPDAPKGGEVTFSVTGTFDSLNGYILKGVPAEGLGGLFDTLLAESYDEPFSKYGLLAESIELAEDRTWVAFRLRPEAAWADGSPVTAEDVVFSFNLIREKGHPFYRTYYADILSAEVQSARRVIFRFRDGSNRELPLIVGQFPVFSKAYYTAHDFEITTLQAPMGSGPYEVARADAGKRITYRLREDYWGKDLPVNRGRNNFGTITYEYFRDATVAVEAFKAGEYDFRHENIAKTWSSAYDVPPVQKGWIVKTEIPHEIPTGMQAFVMNTRRDIFKDIRVRKALNYVFDFEWTNRNLFHGAYHRTTSYFSNSLFASSGLPEGQEKALLEPYKEQLGEEIFTTPFTLPATDGSGKNRQMLLSARNLLREAGWEVQEGKLIHSSTGMPMHIEFLLVSPSFERVVAPILQNLKRLGIEAKMRTVDSAQYIKRIESFDFDIVVNVFGQSNSPGNEQVDFWHSSKADTPGSRNLAGIKSPVVDALVERLVSADNKEALIASARALDRVLLHGYYVIPNWHIRSFRVLYWNKFGRPEILPKYSLGIDTWWIDTEKEKILMQARGKSDATP